ncbi:hypothetical protein LTR37_009387 [Vermiconidia calcicola]|uniref:Uncharacterized protein n=1 Tax=Vermiconidia calcicola TaxID=1690605 RepID=A0ACC3N7Y2_9PEZI|nr:hypothetical protein LTR37_009387 [Vermiconidia calcicola]
MPQLTEPANLPQPPFNQTELIFFNSTIRQTLRPTIPAQQIRIRLSNAFGGADLPITRATIALPRAERGQNITGASGVQLETLQTVTFSGNESITVPLGALAVSDPLNLPINPGQVISISLYLRSGQASNSITSHPGSRAVIWFSHGDYTSSANMTDPSTNQTQHWYFLSAVEAWQAPRYRAFVVVGDSITDGRGSYVNTNSQWPNLLFNRLQESKSKSLESVSVLNQGAGGNRVLNDGLGPSALERIDRDVLAHSGVEYAMLFSGVNDIGTADPTVVNQTTIGDRLIQAYAQITTRVHAAGIPIFGATITPFGCYNSTLQPYSDPIREETRLRVNDWIRNSGTFDAVVDFDAVLRDPRNSTQLAPWFDSGDCLHPNPAGYREMAADFPVDVFGRFEGGVRGFM